MERRVLDFTFLQRFGKIPVLGYGTEALKISLLPAEEPHCPPLTTWRPAALSLSLSRFARAFGPRRVSEKRPARSQQPDVYLEPKWLQYLVGACIYMGLRILSLIVEGMGL